MHVLFLYNRYRQNGGEETAVRAEIELLRSRSVKVTQFEISNDLDSDGFRDKIEVGVTSSWSQGVYRQIKDLCSDVQPDIAHVHNFWMRLSPSVHYACHECGVPTVQTLHNFRLLCVRADFVRQGHICQDCLGHSPWRGVIRRCYRDSLIASTAVAGMISTHRFLNTWRMQVNAFIALSEYSKQKFIEGGLPSEKIFVKPNFLEDRAYPMNPPSISNVLLFVGRLSEEKGVDLLLRAWREARNTGAGILRIIGDGPLRQSLQAQAASYDFSAEEVQFTGALPYREVMNEMGKARALVLPSLCFENCPLTLLEAFCNGRPVLVPNNGALNEMVAHEVTGLKFIGGDEPTLAQGIVKLLSPSAPVDAWGQSARLEYLSKYTPSTNFDKLMRIYRFASRKSPVPSNLVWSGARAGEFF